MWSLTHTVSEVTLKLPRVTLGDFRNGCILILLGVHGSAAHLQMRLKQNHATP